MVALTIFVSGGDPKHGPVLDLEAAPDEEVSSVHGEEEGDEEDAPEHRIVLYYICL
jgi:hypothetical protein